MNNKELKANAIVGVAPLGDPHFGENTLESPKAYTNSKSKIKTLTSDHKGITLIALVITIIVMLILVAVTVTVAINGGLFKTAKQAKADTQKEIDKEQELSNERIEIDGIWYDSFDEYLAGKESPNQGKGNWTLSKEGDTVTSGDVTLNVGDYVNYTYDEVKDAYQLPATITGYKSDKSINQRKDLKWRILGVDSGGCLTLVSESPSSDDVGFGGAKGYNNGVYILNDICAKQYSNNDLGITARSLNMEDVEGGFNDDGFAERSKFRSDGSYYVPIYGGLQEYTSEDNINYPVVYAQENGSGIGVLDDDRDEIKKDGIARSVSYYKEDQLINKPEGKEIMQAGEKEGEEKVLTCTQTYYRLYSVKEKYCKNQIFGDMLFGKLVYYWIASRGVDCNRWGPVFCLYWCNGTELNGSNIKSLYKPDSSWEGCYNLCVRPVVSIDSNIVITPCSGEANGKTKDNMHSLSRAE